MNLDLLEGLLDDLGGTADTARLAPNPDHCCAVLETS
jgi:hypothetical protein